MSFQLFVEMPGGDKVVDTTRKIEDGLDRSAAAAARARDAAGRFAKSATEASAAAAKAGVQAAAGHDRARAAAAGHGDALTNVIHAVEAYIAVHQLESVIDGYVEVRNKIQAVSESQDNLNGLLAETFRIAQDTRSSWDDLSSTYQRIANAARGLGESQRQVLDLTEELAMGMRLSGASSREASMTMMELTHAFTVGTLTGREFRVMMKDAPALMHELQVASGKTGAEFAEMGKHGHISAQLLIDWFGKAREAIRDRFGQTIPTIAEDLQLVRNAAERFFGEAAVGSGVMTQLASAAKYVAEHFEGIAKVALAVGEALIGLFVIEKIIGLVKALTVAVAENPLGAILTAITVGISLLRQFGDELTTNERIWSNVDGQFVTVGDHLRALWTMIKDLGAVIVDFVENAWQKMMAAFGDGLPSDGFELSLRNMLTFLASFVDAAIGLFKFLNDSVVTVFGGIPTMITEILVETLRAVVRGVQDAVNKVIEGINALVAAKNAILPGKSAAEANRDALYDWQKQVTDAARAQGKSFADFGQPTPWVPNRDYVGPLDAEHRIPANGHFARPGETGAPADVLPINDQFRAFAKAQGIQKPAQERDGIAPIDLDFKNPWAGASAAFLQKFRDDWDSDVKGTNVTKDLVQSFMDELDKRAHDEAVKRVQEQHGPGAVSTVKGIPDAKPVDEKELKALEKLRNELRAVLEQSNPVTEAQEKLAHAQDIVNKAVDKGLLSWAQGATAMENYRRKEADALDPLGAWTRKQIEAGAALRDTVQAQDHAAQVLAFENEMKKAGIVVTEAQIAAASHLLTVQQQHAERLRVEQQIMAALLDPQKQYTTALAAAGDLLERGRINAEQYGLAVDEIRAAYLAAKPGAKSFTDGLEVAWLKAKADAASFGQTIASTLVDDFGKLNDAIVTAANGGKVAWSDMVDAMIQDLERLILKQLEVAAIAAIINAVAPGAGGPVAGAVASTGAVPTPDAISSARVAAPTVAAYPTAPVASPRQASQASPQPRVVVNVINQVDKSVPLAAIDSPEGHRQVLNVLRANPGAVRSYTGTRR